VQRTQLGGEPRHVVAVVVVLPQRQAAVDPHDRGAEAADLLADVVDVVLAGHAVPGRLEQRGDRVARRSPAPSTEVERPGRVGGHELDVDVAAAARRTAPVGRTLARGCGARAPRGRRRRAGSSRSPGPRPRPRRPRAARRARRRAPRRARAEGGPRPSRPAARSSTPSPRGRDPSDARAPGPPTGGRGAPSASRTAVASSATVGSYSARSGTRGCSSEVTAA
jgi:hypothetical protein